MNRSDFDVDVIGRPGTSRRRPGRRGNADAAKAGVYERAIVDMLPGTGAQWMSPRGKVVVTTLPAEKPQCHPSAPALGACRVRSDGRTPQPRCHVP